MVGLSRVISERVRHRNIRVVLNQNCGLVVDFACHVRDSEGMKDILEI